MDGSSDIRRSMGQNHWDSWRLIPLKVGEVLTKKPFFSHVISQPCRATADFHCGFPEISGDFQMGTSQPRLPCVARAFLVPLALRRLRPNGTCASQDCVASAEQGPGQRPGRPQRPRRLRQRPVHGYGVYPRMIHNPPTRSNQYQISSDIYK